MAHAIPARPRATTLAIVLPWLLLYASYTLVRPSLLDDADSVHAEVAREMLLRHDPVTLYANGIRYLEKAPLLYWSMAACQWIAAHMGLHSAAVAAAASRIPFALSVLALAFVAESIARNIYRSTRAGLYAGLIMLSSFGVFLFTRITIPDAGVCLWIALSLLCFWRTEPHDGPALMTEEARRKIRRLGWGFAASCALNVLTKGLIGVVFPIAIVLIYLWLTRGIRRGLERLRELPLFSSLLVFLVIAAPWHILAGLANPAQGHPEPFRFIGGHWQVPLPTDGNVRGWFWFYFMNEHVLRYLNLRVPRDYDTVPLLLFWGLCLVWMLPWSAFGFKAVMEAVPMHRAKWRSQFARRDLPLHERGPLLLALWAAVPLLFFSFSTRQEYYVLPSLPAAAVLIAGFLAYRAPDADSARAHRTAGRRITGVLALLGVLAAAACVFLILHTRAPAAGVDLSQLLQQNPGEYALSMGHFLDLNAQAMGVFRVPLALTAISFGIGFPLVWWLWRSTDGGERNRTHTATLVLVASALLFLIAAHMGLATFAPVLSSAQLAQAIQSQVKPEDLLVIHGEYESGSTLGFYLKRRDIHILEGRSSNLWYGSFFPDAPPIFETPASLRAKWSSAQRVFLWQSLTDAPNQLPPLDGPVYVLTRSGGKEIVSNRP